MEEYLGQSTFMTNKNWYNSLKNKISHDENKIGFYSRVIQRRWILAIKRTLCDINQGGTILKTDAWNEASGKGLMQEFKDNYNVHICDISESIVDLIKKDYPNSYTMDIRKLRFKKNYFDAILDISTSDHCKEVDLEDIIAGYSYVLKPKGKLLLIHNSNKSIFWKLLVKFGKSSPAYSGFPPAYYFSPSYVLKLLQNDFEILEIRCTNAFSWAKPILNIIPILNVSIINFLASIELNISHTFLSRLGRQYIFFCRKKESSIS
jgi:SAM-dependent methyltransferase